MARSFRIDFGCTMTKIARRVRLHYSSICNIDKPWEKVNSRFKT